MLQIREKQGETGMPGPGDPPKEYQFKPGQSGNSKGRPPGKTLTRLIEKLADERFEGDQTRAEAFVVNLWDRAISGDPDATRHVLERLEGKVTDRTEISGAGGEALGLTINIVKDRDAEDDAD